MTVAALFDLDRTLVRRETASLYARYLWARGDARLRDVARVLYWVAQYTAGVVDPEEVASRAVASLAGMPEAVMAARCDDLVRVHVERHVADRGRRAVRAHQLAGHVVAIVTGATAYSARPVARRLGIDHVVASELELDAKGRFTGRVEAPLCYGAGKVVRARRLADALGFRLEEAWFYSDSYTDLPLLEEVRVPVIVNPDPRLARVARARAWRVERW